MHSLAPERILVVGTWKEGENRMAVEDFRKRLDIRLCLFRAIVGLSLCVSLTHLIFAGKGARAFAAPARHARGLVVTYEDGRLTIDARNSSLSDILLAVSKETGAVIDSPPDVNEHLTVHTGPGRMEDVLGSVLRMAGYNYMINEPTKPGAKVLVVLRPGRGGSAAPEPVPEPAAADPQPTGVGQWRENDDPAQAMLDRRQAVADRRRNVRELIDQRLMEKQMESDAEGK